MFSHRSLDMFALKALNLLFHWISSSLLSVCNSCKPTGSRSIRCPQLFLTCSLDGFNTHTHTHPNPTVVWQKTFTSLQQHLTRTGKVNEQEWFAWKHGSKHTMCFTVKLLSQLWGLREHTTHTNRLPKGPFPQKKKKKSAKRVVTCSRLTLKHKAVWCTQKQQPSGRCMDILKQVQLSISQATAFPAHSVSMCAAVLLRRAGWSGGVGGGRHSRRLCDDNLLQHSACSHMYSWNATHSKQQIELHTNQHTHTQTHAQTRRERHDNKLTE